AAGTSSASSSGCIGQPSSNALSASATIEAIAVRVLSALHRSSASASCAAGVNSIRRVYPCEHTFVSGEATILHADLDAFFASVEQRDDPRLRGRPVIVGVGVVLAASYEAKAYGIDSAMGGAQARRLCPQAIVVSPRMSAYAEASKAVYRVFDDTTPLVEGLSIDEAFLRSEE